MSRTNYLPGMVYLMITSLLPEWNYFSGPVAGQFPVVVCTFLVVRHLQPTQCPWAPFSTSGWLLAWPDSVCTLPHFLDLGLLAYGGDATLPLNEWLICILGSRRLFASTRSIF